MGERFLILRKYIRAVTKSEVTRVDESDWGITGWEYATKVQYSQPYRKVFQTMTPCTFIIQCNGYVDQSISLEKQLNIIQVADLVRPDRKLPLRNIPLWSFYPFAMLIVIITFAFRLLSTQTEAFFKIVDLDEAWSFYR